MPANTDTCSCFPAGKPNMLLAIAGGQQMPQNARRSERARALGRVVDT
jgi:hypothetical protein